MRQVGGYLRRQRQSRMNRLKGSGPELLLLRLGAGFFSQSNFKGKWGLLQLIRICDKKADWLALRDDPLGAINQGIAGLAKAGEGGIGSLAGAIAGPDLLNDDC